MKKRSVSSGPAILIISFVLTAVGGFVTWRLFPVPFGTLFETFLALTLAGLVLCLAALAVMALRSGPLWLKAAGIVPAVLALALALAGIVLKYDYRLLPGTCYRYGLSAEEWREDVRYFAGQFPEKHVRLFEMVPREEFESAASALEQSVPSLDENGIKNGIYKLAAMPGDAHSYPNIFTHKLDWHSLPFKLWLFDDGVYVLDAGREHGDMVGARIVEIGGVPVAEAYERLRPYLSHESESGWKERFLYCLGVAEFLKAEGLARDTGSVELTFETSEGIRVTRKIGTYHYVPVIYWSSLRPVDNDVPFVITNDRKDNWRFEFLEDTATLYLRFNACQRVNGEERIEDFVERLGKWIEENEFERLVCDIRSNGGGDAYVSQQIAALLTGNPKVDLPGRFFVLTSRRTFSAAVMFLSLVENRTKAVIVGEPTGQGPFFCGGPQPVTLPNSGLQILAATHYNRCSLFDDGRESIEPDLPVAYGAEDFFAGRDPMMDAVMAYEEPERAVILDAGEEERLAGRYAFSPCQVLTVEKEGERLVLRIDDFFDGSYRNVRTGLYRAQGNGFDTDIDGVSVVFHVEPGKAAKGVTVRWRGIESYAGKADDETLLPMEMFAEGRTEEAVEILYEQRDIYRSEIPDLEARLNGMGYALLREEKDAQAIDVLELNTRLFPGSANTYDSLGEACMLSGDRERAMRLYEKALELNPGSANARDILDRLRKGQTWDRENRRWAG